MIFIYENWETSVRLFQRLTEKRFSGEQGNLVEVSANQFYELWDRELVSDSEW